MRKFLVRSGPGWVIAWHRGCRHRPEIVRNLYGWSFWLGPLGIGRVR